MSKANDLIRDFMCKAVHKAHSQEAYEQWFARKVAEGRAAASQGLVMDNAEVETEAAERRMRLLSQAGERQWPPLEA